MDPDSVKPEGIEVDADGLPVHAKDLPAFSKWLEAKPLPEKLRLLALATKRLTRDAD
jgi:hypothetical protein